MGLITIEMFATLDLVGQAPGGPDEDPEGFPFGGWQAPLMDDEAGAQIGAAYEGTDALLLGRRTYDIFAGFWPFQEGGEDDEIATLFNRIPKYVASRGTPDLSWAGSSQLGPDLPSAVREIRDRHEDIKVVGSLDLVQSLLREKLFDRLDLWVHPIVLGVGKKVFENGAVPTNLALLAAAGRQSERLRVPALRDRRRHARDGRHERPRPRCTVNAPTSITVTPVHVADLVAEGELMPVCVHVIDHPDGRVLVDTGLTELHPAVADMDPRLRPVSEWDLDLAGIDIVVNTHLHFDHCGGNHLFAGTPTYVQRRELDDARSLEDYTIREWVEAPGVQYVPVDGELELLPGIRLVPTPGHTNGSQVVVVEKGERPTVIAGDTAVWFGELDEPKTEGQLLVRAMDPEMVWLSHTHEPWRPPAL